MLDPLYLQQEEHSCKILYICNKRSTQVRSSIYTIRFSNYSTDRVSQSLIREGANEAWIESARTLILVDGFYFFYIVLLRL